MNFTALKFGFGAAIATAATAATLITSAPAQALTIAGRTNYSALTSLPTTLTVINEVAVNNDLTQGFTNISRIRVNSLVLNAGSSLGTASYNSTVGFLTNFRFNGKAARLNLNQGDVLHTIVNTPRIGRTPAVRSASTTAQIFSAIIEGLDGTDFATATGSFTATQSSSSRLFTMNIDEVQVIPTPALLPAALGFGAAMLRKRKGEAAEAEQETAEVEA